MARRGENVFLGVENVFCFVLFLVGWLVVFFPRFVRRFSRLIDQLTFFKFPKMDEKLATVRVRREERPPSMMFLGSIAFTAVRGR